MSDTVEAQTANQNSPDQIKEEDLHSEFQVQKSKTKNKKSKWPKSDAVISVSDPVVIEEKFGKHTVYTIQGTDQKGAFKVSRRYSDFDKIRSTLMIQWPGLYIPPLPPKKAVNNMDTEFIEQRLEGLSTFCKTVSKVYHLHYSEEYQAFIHSPSNDVEKLLHPFQKVKPQDIVSKYTTVFAHLSEKELNSKTVPKIFVFRMMYLSKLKEKLQLYKKYSKRVAKSRANYYNQLGAFHALVCIPYERLVITEIHEHAEGKGVFDDAKNTKLHESARKMADGGARKSLELVYDYIREKLHQIEALSEAIDQRDKYHAMRTKAQDKHKSEKHDLDKVKAGKFTMKTLFSKNTSKEDEISEISKNISSATKDIEGLNMLNDMITLVLAYHTIPKFIKSNLGEFGKTLRNAGQTELINLGNLEEYWDCILQNENLQRTQLE